MMLLIRYEQLD